MGISSLRAQHGEDRLLAERFSHRRDGHYVEVGALDGEYLSNTYYFEKELGWRGVLVEPNPTQAALCRTHRPASIVAQFAAVAPGHEGTVTLGVTEGDEGYSTLSPNRTYSRILSERDLVPTPVDVQATTLDRILDDAGLPSIDFMTIDVEGHELEALRGMDLGRWRPTVLLIESASGAPGLRMSWLLFRGGYARVRRVVVNDWYEQLPLLPRTGRLVMAYVTSVPDVLRITARETLRRLGLLERLRARRAGRP